MTNEERYQKAVDAITDLYSDKSVTRGKARENLETLQGEISILLDTLQDDEPECADEETPEEEPEEIENDEN